MQRSLPTLEVDLLIEHGAHGLNLRGSGASFVSLQVAWRKFRGPVKRIA
jgi:hypothetical protein